MSGWEPAGPGRKYNLGNGPADNTVTELSSVSTPSAGAAKAGALLSPENPLFVFGALAALTFGFMAFGTSVRVGKTTASLNVGDTK